MLIRLISFNITCCFSLCGCQFLFYALEVTNLTMIGLVLGCGWKECEGVIALTFFDAKTYVYSNWECLTLETVFPTTMSPKSLLNQHLLHWRGATILTSPLLIIVDSESLSWVYIKVGAGMMIYDVTAVISTCRRNYININTCLWWFISVLHQCLLCYF